MPCQDNEFHYFDTLQLLKAYNMTIDERFVKAVPKWEQEAQQFNSPLPLLYSPSANIFLSIYPFDKEKIIAFLQYINKLEKKA